MRELPALGAAAAEINAESERQTRKDTTKGEPVEMGERRAVAADEVAGPS
jgi:membrane protein